MGNQEISSRKAKAGAPQTIEVRKQIIAATADLLAENPDQKLRFETLAKRVGCNRATLYRYFDSKTQLLEAVMLALMNEITTDIIARSAQNRQVNRQSFTHVLFEVIRDLSTNPRYALVMQDENIKLFARLTQVHFVDITTQMLERFTMDEGIGRILKPQVELKDAVIWLIHQIIAYGFFGIPGNDEKAQKAFLEKMVVSVII